MKRVFFMVLTALLFGNASYSMETDDIFSFYGAHMTPQKVRGDFVSFFTGNLKSKLSRLNLTQQEEYPLYFFCDFENKDAPLLKVFPKAKEEIHVWDLTDLYTYPAVRLNVFMPTNVELSEIVNPLGLEKKFAGPLEIKSDKIDAFCQRIKGEKNTDNEFKIGKTYKLFYSIFEKQIVHYNQQTPLHNLFQITFLFAPLDPNSVPQEYKAKTIPEEYRYNPHEDDKH